jgi:hypothetical protein
MISTVITYSQQSLDLYGNHFNDPGSRFRLNSFESNTMNSNTIKDWELSFIYGGVSSGSRIGNDIFLVSLGKRINDNYFYFRYTPGIKKEFAANTLTSVTSGDSNRTEVLTTSITYEEKFGAGYAIDLISNLTLGITLRYFRQSLTEDNVEFIYGDSISAETKTITEKYEKKFWRGDIGLSYFPVNNLRLSLSSANLFLLNENGGFEEDTGLELRNEKLFIVGLNYNPADWFSTGLNYESSNSFALHTVYRYNFGGGGISAGITAHHDKYQNPFINSLMPNLSYSSPLFNVSLSAVKYLSDRSGAKSINDLIENGIHNILNNRYSNDKLLLSVNFALSFAVDKSAQFVDVKLLDEIYPTLGDEYTNKPFAVAKVVNISGDVINVKPSSFIEEINSEKIYSPIVSIQPGDTSEIPFYTIIDDSKRFINKRAVSQANFYLTTAGSDYDDEMSKPVLINDKNSWDGKVSNLRYFSNYDYQYSTTFTKAVLSGFKAELDTVNEYLSDFITVKTLFNEFVKRMVYVSDPRSSVEYVQFPEETIERKGGDCDDLSVSFSSLLESIGIQTAFVDYKETDNISHVNLLINTKLNPSLASLITGNDKKYYVRTDSRQTDEIWIPLEMTSLTDFETAWSAGASKFYKEAIEDLGLAKGNIQIIENY